MIYELNWIELNQGEVYQGEMCPNSKISLTYPGMLISVFFADRSLVVENHFEFRFWFY